MGARIGGLGKYIGYRLIYSKSQNHQISEKGTKKIMRTSIFSVSLVFIYTLAWEVQLYTIYIYIFYRFLGFLGLHS